MVNKFLCSYVVSLLFVVHAEEDKKEGTRIETAHTCVKVHVDQRLWVKSLCSIPISLCSIQNILQYVNKQVKRAENKQRLADLQAKMDYSAMEKAQHPIAQLFKVWEISRLAVHNSLSHWMIVLLL